MRAPPNVAWVKGIAIALGIVVLAVAVSHILAPGYQPRTDARHKTEGAAGLLVSAMIIGYLASRQTGAMRRWLLGFAVAALLAALYVAFAPG